jgi:hypothetical protein
MFYSPLIGTSSNSTAQQTQREARHAKDDVEFIKHDIERLLMITEALWLLLKKEHGYEDSVLTKLIAEIDLRDGKRDGRVAKDSPEQCAYCGRAVSSRRPFCIFCGKPVETQPFAR